MWYCRKISLFSFSRYNICHTLIENVNKRRPFYWLHMNYIDCSWKQPYVCTRGNIPMGILWFLRPLDFLQTTYSDAFARSILRIVFLERNSVRSVREIYSRRRHTCTITKYRDYESFMDGNAPVSTKLK